MSKQLSGTNGHQDSGPHTGLNLRRLFARKKLVVVGGTGFLGKLWWSLLLARYPEIERIYLLVRSKGDRSAEQRFAEEIAVNGALEPLCAEHGERFAPFLADKVVPIAGDVVHPYCGLSTELRAELRGEIAAVVNVSGIVDFEPPLDLALEVNAFGVQNLVALARDLNDCPILHTSTCFVAGNRTGYVEEVDPRAHPFPRAGELERAHWDPNREIAECLDIIAQAKQRADDAFRQSHFLNEARANLIRAHEPASGKTLEREIERVRRRYVEALLAEMGNERARFWGWPNTYTYTKSIGEQIAAASGLPFTIVRPAIVESSQSYPMPGWNEGINTSAPLIYAIREGQTQLPGSHHNLDMIPCDMVASGIILALGELLEGTAPAVYQLGSSDSNPVTMARVFELSGLYKRKYHQRLGKGSLISFLQAHVEGALFSSSDFQKYGPEAVSRAVRGVDRVLRAGSIGAVSSLLEPTRAQLERFAGQQEKVARLLGRFAPFTADYDYTFRCDHVRAAYARLGKDDKLRLNWAPESIDWRRWFLDVHMPGLEKWVFPEIDRRLARPPLPAKAYETLPALLAEMAERHDLACALQYTETDGLSRVSFRDWHERALACAARLVSKGIGPGDRVLLLGSNHPAWPLAFFGILAARAVVVPLDPEMDPAALGRIASAARAKLIVLDSRARARFEPELDGRVIALDLQGVVRAGNPLREGSERSIRPSDVAVELSASGASKGALLSHRNLTSSIAALFPVFPLSPNDRVLSVLPLHHPLELTCGLLLPLARGARVVYLDRVDEERVEQVLKTAQITAVIAVPAFWDRFGKALASRISERGLVVKKTFELALELNRSFGKRTGLDLGRVLFGGVHRKLGGQLRHLLSSGGTLPEPTHRLFAGLGLHLTEGYGATEAHPLLSVSRPGPRAKRSAGRAIPGMELRIENPDSSGVGEILARGPGVIASESGVRDGQQIDAEGWIRTGDLGRLDAKGNLELVGRVPEPSPAEGPCSEVDVNVDAPVGASRRSSTLS